MCSVYPFGGWGRNGFDAYYMPFQAEYFLSHPNSKFLLLADSLTHPFNEFLLFAIQYGIIGLLFLLLCSCLIIKKMVNHTQRYKSLFISFCITLFIWCSFSYPYQVPFIKLITIYLVAIVLYLTVSQWKCRKIISYIILISSIPVFISMAISYHYQWEWTHIQEKSLAGETQAVLPQYADLHKHLKDNGAFLYNYGAEMHYIKQYKESLNILEECTHKYNDYNVQMLIADNYQQLGYTEKALERYRYANLMIPSKLLPLYYEMKIYMEKGDSIKACNTARIIINKPIKIKKS